METKKCLLCGKEFEVSYLNQNTCIHCLSKKDGWNDVLDERPCDNCNKNTIKMKIEDTWYCLHCKSYEK